MKKKVNTDALKNELQGSVFFPAPVVSSTQSQEPKEIIFQDSLTPSTQEVKDTSIHGYKGTSTQVPKHTRPTKTHTYELYVDQVKAIKRLALEEELNGGEGNQSKFVREAIDEYLKKKG